MSLPADRPSPGTPAADLVVLLGSDGRLTLVQSGTLEEVAARVTVGADATIAIVNHQDRPALCRAITTARTPGGPPSTVEVRLDAGAGAWQTCQVTVVGTGPADARSVLLRIRDVTHDHRRRFGGRLERGLLAHLPAAVVAVDDDAIVQYWNLHAEQLFGYEAADVLGHRVDTLVDRILPRDDLAGLLDHLGHHDSWEGDYTIRRPDGSTLPAILHIRPIEPHTHGVSGMVALAIDATARDGRDQAAALRSLRDELTGLANRALFVDQVDEALRRRDPGRSSVGVVRIDLDRFHEVNDRYGHEVGDRVLVAMARRLSGADAPGFGAARVAGDGFALYAEHLADESAIEAIGARVLDLLGPPVNVALPGDDDEVVAVRLTASIGVSIARNGGGPDALLRNAEVALVAAKARGGDCIETFDDAHHRQLREGAADASRLRDALDEGAVEVWFQPIMTIDDHQLMGFEVLVRWRQPDGSIVAPMRFIPLAEEHGLIERIGDLALGEAASALESWHAEHPHLFVAVNLSPVEISGTLVDRIDTVLGGRFSPDRLVVEITESVMMDPHVAVSGLRELHDRGVRVAIDDFGTGHSSLSRLVELPVDELKIDRRFVEAMAEDPTSRLVVRAVVHLARDLGLGVIAEGVETEAQRAELAALGCPLGQGYLWSPAVPRPAADRLVAGLGT